MRVVSFVFLLAVGCGGSSTADRAGAEDAGIADSGPVDGTPDAGPEDAGPTDDRGVLDAGPADAAPIDANTVALEVSLIEDGQVVSEPPGIDCPGTCAAAFPRGETVELRAVEHGERGIVFVEWTEGCEGDGLTCSVDPEETMRVTAQFGRANFAFLTVDSAPLNQGVAAFDALCAAEASAAGLPGTYVAYVSTTAASSIERLAGARGWLRPDGLMVADTVDDLSTPRLGYPIRIRADGTLTRVPWPGNYVTGSQKNGSLGPNCQDFSAEEGSATLGSSESVGERFNQSGTGSCRGGEAPVICMGVDHDTPVKRRGPENGRLVFVSQGRWSPPGGLEGADAHCTMEAFRVGLFGTYTALLGTTGQSAASRIDPGGASFVRIDGLKLAPSNEAFLQGFVDTPPFLDQFGDPRRGVYVGASSITSEEPVHGNCGDWTVGNTTELGDLINPDSVYFFSRIRAASYCGARYRLYCVEDRSEP